MLIQQGGNYGRIYRVSQRHLIAGFGFRRGIYVRLSDDDGKSWEEPIQVVEMPGGNCTNTELCVLDGRQILCFFNFRPAEGSGKAYTIGMCKSSNRGRTWSSPTILYTAAEEFKDGCWEPACIQLPDGELQVYFANENPYRTSNEQQISMLRSTDYGKTWGEMETISFRKKSRDGMPVPVVPKDGKSIYVAIEDNGLSGRFKPVIVSSRISKNGWHDGVVGGESRNRWSALADPLPAETYAGAPYLRQLVDGRFVLSYQLAPSGNMDDSRMAVSIGNDKAKRFGEPSFPFTSDSGVAQLWNSLFIKDEKTVTAVTQTTIGGKHGIWAIDGKLVD
ncbi:exo-alpha-sialidase [Luteolibacter pohnpeiensis]|uniref:Exo-alpha-sialidase n=1 Tax=Luteolibacter pohnpeiensis TaxID=454153 RepID=A0A934VY45_9BACT|nr:sialidase family protein [Luteolibacter pohnpeiensis]MBK1884164.1 exo-alpha-sialidase [Luteolibacter pohnpeiensis]